jgi:hypothetical protein
MDHSQDSCHALGIVYGVDLVAGEVLPEQPARQWALSFSYPLCLLFTSRPEIR